MTNQQGAPEALRLADAISNLLCSNEVAARTIAAAADELVRLHALAAGQATAAQQGVAYAALPDEGEPWRGHKFKEVQRGCWRCDCGKTIKEVTSDQSTPASGGNYPVMPKRYTVDDDGEELFTAEKMRAFADATHTMRASHGEAPAQPAQPIACSYGDNGYACCEGGPCQADVHNDKLAEQQAPATVQADSVQEPATVPRFNCWSTNEGDSWFDHPADSQAIYDCLGNDANVGDEYELTAGWKSVTARYRITEVVGDGEEYEVECISHPHENSAPQPPTAQAAESVPAPVPPPECETEAEKRAFAFGWFKALESERMKADNKKKDPL